MRKLIIFTLTVMFLFSTININIYAKVPDPPNVSADGAVLMDGNSGQILYEKNMNASYPPASTTKVMTALLTLEKCKLDDKVKVSNDFTTKYLALRDGNSIGITNGEELTVRDLLHALLLISANDAAVALAEHISGSPQAFATLMNKKAAELGCTNTNFKNPNGLYDKDHKTSAKDLALIMKELSKYPEYQKISTTLNYQMSPTNNMDAEKTKKSRNFWNEDKLVYKNSKNYYDKCIGGKAGYTILSLHSFVSVANNNGRKLVVALVHSKEKTFYDDSKALFEYGFNNFQQKKLFSKGDIVENYYLDGTKIPLLASEDYYYCTENGSKSVPKVQVDKNSLKKKYFSKGTQIMTAKISIDGKQIGTLKLNSAVTVKSNKLSNANSISGYFEDNKAIIGCILAAILLILALQFLRIKVRQNKDKSSYF
ncbi:peptidase M15 [Clostridium acetobutylicum]|nr:peptidase M15 [Clostridium acetobutylicum]